MFEEHEKKIKKLQENELFYQHEIERLTNENQSSSNEPSLNNNNNSNIIRYFK